MARAAEASECAMEMEEEVVMEGIESEAEEDAVMAEADEGEGEQQAANTTGDESDYQSEEGSGADLEDCCDSEAQQDARTEAVEPAPRLPEHLAEGRRGCKKQADGTWTVYDKKGVRWVWVTAAGAGEWQRESKEAWWARFERTRDEKQNLAVEAIRKALKDAGPETRALVQMACGTGKTRVALKSCEAILRDIVTSHSSSSAPQDPFIIAIFVPSIALIPQTAHEWHTFKSEEFEYELVSVCSERDLEQKQEQKQKSDKRKRSAATDIEIDDSESQGMSVEECEQEMHRLPDSWRRVIHSGSELKDYLEKPPAVAAAPAKPRVMLIISTYHSADIVGKRLDESETPTTVTICDEAHLTAIKRTGSGRVDFTRPLREGSGGVPSQRRLFLTATPRLEKSKKHKDGGDKAPKDDVVAMDGEEGEKNYGQTAFSLPMAEAIELELVRDYDICVMGIRPDAESEIEWLRDQQDAITKLQSDPVRQQAAQLLAVSQAMQKRDLRKAFLFYSRINDVENAYDFASDRDRQAALFGPVRAIGEGEDDGGMASNEVLTAPRIVLSKVHSKNKNNTEELERFKGANDDELALVFNVRSLGTGINVPDAKTNGFMAGMGTPEGVAQAIGRVQRQRKEDGPGVKALIVLPVLLLGEDADGAGGDDEGNTGISSDETAKKKQKKHKDADSDNSKRGKGRNGITEEGSGWSTVHNVFAALRKIDTRYGDAFRQLRKCMAIKVKNVQEQQRATALQLIQGNLSVEMARLGDDPEYASRLTREIEVLRKRVIAEEVERTPARTWEEMVWVLKEYKRVTGDCNVPAKYDDDPQLGTWVDSQKTQYRKPGHGWLAQYNRLERLKEIGAFDDWEDNTDEAKWNKTFERLKEYKRKKGDCNVPFKYDDDPQLGTWVDKQKQQYRKEGHGLLAQGNRLKMLREIGALDDWDKAAAGRTPPTKQTWEEMYERLKEYKRKNGDCNVPRECKDDPQLARWANSQKTQYRKEGHGNLAQGDRLEMLKEIGALDDWEANSDESKWKKNYESLREYKRVNGDCNVPRKFADKPQLGTWVDTQKGQYRKEGHGTLAQGKRLEMLKEIGALDDWDKAAAGRAPPTKQTWEEMYERLREYKMVNGDCNVPQKYDDDRQLGKWVNWQKTQYKKEGHGTLAQGKRVEMLKEVGALEDWKKVKKGPKGPLEQNVDDDEEEEVGSEEDK